MEHREAISNCGLRIADCGFKRRNLQLRLAFSFRDSKSSMTCLQPQAKRSSNLQRQRPKHHALFATDHGPRTSDKKPSSFCLLPAAICQLCFPMLNALCPLPYTELEPQILWIMGLTDNRQQGNLAL